jgi:hypothetical protein
MIQGVSRGLDDVERRNERKEDRAYELKRRGREDTQYEQGQEDRTYQVSRRQVTDQRTDEQYDIQREQQQFAKDFDEAMRRYAVSDGADYQGLQDIYNNKYPDKGKVMMRRDEDGTFTVQFTRPDGTTEVKEGLNFDQLGEMAMGMRDPNKWMENRRASSAAAAERKGKHEDAVDLERVRGEESRKTERVKAGIKGEDGKVPEHSKVLATRAKEYYGGTFANGMWSFEAGKETKAAVHADLAERLYLAMPSEKRSTNTAHLRAARVMKDIETQAEKVADDEVKAGRIGKRDRDERVEQLTQEFGEQVKAELEARSGAQPMEREGTGDGRGKPAPGAPKAGDVVDGYRFKGGNPNDPKNWAEEDASEPAAPVTLERQGREPRKSSGQGGSAKSPYSDAQVAEMVRLLEERRHKGRQVVTQKHLAAAVAAKEAAWLYDQADPVGKAQHLDPGTLRLALASGDLKKRDEAFIRRLLGEGK